MKSKIIIVATLAALVIFINSSQAQRRYDPETVNITRWIDTTTSPITFDDYNKTRNFAPDDNIQIIRQATISTDEIIDIIINEDLYPQIADVLDTFFNDLQLDGYSINLYTAAETRSPANLRAILHDDWTSQGITGVIFIGDLAVPWYEMDEPESWGGRHVMFPCDLYFMDLDGDWGDADYDDMFDSHYGYNLYADIWCGRLKSSVLHYHNADEVTRLRNYFHKNHEYRAGNLRLNDHALAFIDKDWNLNGWDFDVAMAYPSTDRVIDVFETNRNNYINLVQENSNNQYEHVLICFHSSPFAHYIYRNYDNYDLFYNHEIETCTMQALSFNLFACSNARYVENDNMGAWYIFETEYGLVSIGSSKTGSMLCFEDFYQPLGQGASFGESFLTWAQLNMEFCAGDNSRPWFYGMCLQGDPTLRLGYFQPPLQYCIYEPGDINGDGVIIGSDITYAAQYFRGGAPPPDSCWDDETEDWFYVAADANGSCEFIGSDITYLVNYFRGIHESVLHCPRFPLPSE